MMNKMAQQDKPNPIKWLMKRWEVSSYWQFSVIFLVFGLTGSSAVYVKKPIYTFLEIPSELDWWYSIPLWLVVTFPVYQLLLLFYGTLLGQFRFFWEFEKKMWKRMLRRQS